MNILVTGGLGFIGSKLVKRLESGGYAVDVVDVKEGLDCRVCSNLPHISVPDVIFHLASHNNAVESMTNVEKYMENVEMTQGVIDFAFRLASKPKIVFSSSCAVYGQPLSNPVKETDLAMPINVYGFTKLVSESLLRKYGNYVILRFGNVYGEGSGIFAQQLRKMKNVCLYTYDAGKTLGRDYVRLDDAVQTLVQSMKIQGEIVNVGTGKAVSYLDLLPKNQNDVRVSCEKCPQFIPHTISLNTDKLKSLFGFIPKPLDLKW